MSSKPIVAIVGRPNVGKSTLFNRLLGERKAIVEDVAGVTRDRLYDICSWGGHEFVIIDTGGIRFDEGDVFTSEIKLQAELALLVFAVRPAGPGRYAAGDKLSGRFGDKQNGVAHLRKGVLHPTQGCGLSGTRAACDDDFGNIHSVFLLPLFQQIIHADME